MSVQGDDRDQALRDKPYSTRQEYWNDWLTFVDLLLEELYRVKAVGSPRPAGIAITFEEVSAALEEHAPLSADGEGRTVLIEAYNYIMSRVQVSDSLLTGFDWICAMLSLSPLYRIALLLSLSVYLDRKYEKIYAVLNDDQVVTVPSLGTALAATALLGLAPDEDDLAQIYGASREFRLLFERHPQPGMRMGLSMPLQPHPIIVQTAFQGIGGLAPELNSFCRLWAWDSPLEEAVVGGELVERLTSLVAGIDSEEDYVSSRAILLSGRNGSGRGFAARHVAQRLSVNLVEVDMRQLPDLEGQQMESFLLSLTREFALRPCMLFLRWCAPTRETAPLIAAVIEGVAAFAPLFWISAEPEDVNLVHTARVSILDFEISPPGYGETAALFEQYAAYLPVGEDVNFEEISARYRMLPETVKQSLETARMLAYADDSEEITTQHIVSGISACRTTAMEGLGSIVNAGYTWNDIVTSPTNVTLMKLAVDHIKYRNVVGERWGMDKKNAYGRGICVLFYGAPGTGKTMAAHVLANEAGMELFKIDASQLTSKYIGETSKNLSQVFDSAKGSNVILFFDEADAIFGRRSDVKDSNDRYANNDTAFLLQKIEEYDGMTILSTNLLSNIDDAFRRRVTYAINFQSPSQELREALWRSLISEEMPCEELDFPFLSKFEMTGSGIKSILLSAAYMAASEEGSLSMRHILKALQYYMTKAGKTLSRNELIPYDGLVY